MYSRNKADIVILNWLHFLKHLLMFQKSVINESFFFFFFFLILGSFKSLLNFFSLQVFYFHQSKNSMNKLFCYHVWSDGLLPELEIIINITFCYVYLLILCSLF